MSTLNTTKSLLSLFNMGLRINGKGKVETDSQLESPQHQPHGNSAFQISVQTRQNFLKLDFSLANYAPTANSAQLEHEMCSHG